MRYPSLSPLLLSVVLGLGLTGCNEDLRSTTDATGSADEGGLTDGGGNGGTGPSGGGSGTPLSDSELDPDSDVFSYDANGYEGRVVVSLHPQEAVATDTDTGVVFAVPFPQGWLTDADSVSLHDDKGEVPIRTKAVGHWWDPNTGEASSIRSVRVSLKARFSSREPLTLELRWGGPRDKELGTGIDVTSTWIPITESGIDEAEYTTTEILEPAVYATLPSAWLSMATLRNQTTPLGEWRESGWFDEALLGYSRTMVNDVSDAVSEEDLVKYEPDSWDAPDTAQTGAWLFDRASTLWGVYFRTGDVKWLRHAHRASQFYALNIERDNDSSPADSSERNIRGHFRLKDISYVDQKYSYGLPMLLDRLVLGAAADGPAAGEDGVRAVSDLIQNNYWEQNFGPAGAYDPAKGANFTWTERHQAYAFSAHLTAWEYTGDEAYRDKLDAYVAQMVDHVANPPGDLPVDGCLVHRWIHHQNWDKYGEVTPVCSPWMTALLAEPLWRYYRLTDDSRALGLLADFAESVTRYGTYVADDSTGTSPGSNIYGKRVPQYLYSSEYLATTDGTSGPYPDREHTCDVAGLVARGVTAGRLLDRDMSQEASVAGELVEGCQAVLDTWHRPGDATYLRNNGPAWRLTPPRKYNWWFGTTHDLPWLMEFNE